MPFKTFDVFDQAALTDDIRRPPAGRAPGAAEDAPQKLGELIAPSTPTYETVVKVNVQEIKPFGIGQFRAWDASVPLFKPENVWSEILMELVLIDEQERIKESEWRKLNSPNEEERRSAGVQLIDKGKILKLRNERAAEWMRWKMFQDALVVPFSDGTQEIAIASGMQASHKPQAGVSWADATNADPVADIQAWSGLLADDTGFYGRHIHMNSKTFNYLIYSAKIRNAVNFYAAGANSILRPRREEILSLFETFSTALDIVVYDNGYRATGEAGIGRPSLTKYLPDGYVLMTTEYTLDGVRIADTLDGVVSVSTAWNEIQLRQGMQSEVLVDHESKNHLIRVASAKMPRLLIPDAFVWARVVF
jgi:hypothetical protein